MDYKWQYVILDEAQAIKNPGTKQTRAVKKIPAVNRIVMTGTPVENRLSDLWSLFDFVNPGLLGSSKEFASFSKGLADHPDGYGRLRRMTSPFILRRLKSDKSIITDLPDKVEMKCWAALSQKQVVVYQQLVDNITAMLETTEGIQRKGMILAALTKFKQICNHPDQYAGVDGYHETESGKFARLREICTTIYAKRERVLIFTQFKEMTEPLARFLEVVFEHPGLIIHGTVPVGKRKKIIEQFQSNEYIPFLVLSLKAGGVGLNLTRANHVIHFDRWWNPAVENQATDRAFRIGQQKNVMVHKFITKGTIEEKIDEMLTMKAKLADSLVTTSGEAWLTEMKNEELADLFRLTK
jgi:non-specific serine/threonine protein kinase